MNRRKDLRAIAVKEIASTGIALTTERNTHRLLNTIVKKAVELSGCDTGAFYFLNGEYLELKLCRCTSMNIYVGKEGEEFHYRPVYLTEKHICAYCAISKEIIEVENVYESSEYDFSASRAYDAMNDYHTQSMMAIPMTNPKGELIGVLQLINALNAKGEIIPFDSRKRLILQALASQAAVSLSNTLYLDEIRRQIFSFVSALSTAIDERTPYNGAHTRKVAIYAAILADYINTLYWEGKEDEYFDQERKDQLYLAATLHDIGKMIVPLEVMNKATRLEGKLEALRARFQLIEAYMEIDQLKGKLSSGEFSHKVAELKEILAFIEETDKVGFLTDEAAKRIEEIGTMSYQRPSGEKLFYLTREEQDCLSIRKGTLTAEERKIMESHVIMTKKILDKVHFTEKYSRVNAIASNHHECLDGSGYPNGFRADKLDLEARMLAVVDIFDALTSTDRPYKKPMSKEKAFEIIEQMVGEGKLDQRVTEWLKEALKEVDITTIEENYSVDWT